MKLFDQIMRKKLDLSEESNINMKYKRGVWQFYNAYNIALAITRFPDKNIAIKNRLIRRFLMSPDYVDSKVFKKIQKFMRDDFNIIIKAFRIIEQQRADSYEFGEYYKPFSLGILAYEYPDQE